MRYCKKCLQPDTRPGVLFDEEQVCYACRYEEKKVLIDWKQREKDLKDIVEEAKHIAKLRQTYYDCVIGVSGGKDSTFQAVYAKEKLGLNPLLVNSMPDAITKIGEKNLTNLANLGFDIISMRPNPMVAKETARRGFFERGNIVAASEYSLWASAYIIADKFNIPLILQGENAALTLGTALNQETTGDAFSVVQLDTIKGCNAKDWISDKIRLEQLYMYQFPDIRELKNKQIKAVFLQYYAKEWSQIYNAEFSIARGLLGRTEENLHDIGRYRRYTALDSDLVIANQMIKYLKFGFGFTTDEVCYDIREGRLSREDAIWYVKEYDGKCGDKYIDIVCNYLSISKEEFWNVVDKYVNKKLFQKDQNGKWIPKFEPGIDF